MKIIKRNRCSSCGVSWNKHMGATGLCEELQIVMELLAASISLLQVYRKKIKNYEKTTKSRKSKSY